MGVKPTPTDAGEVLTRTREHLAGPVVDDAPRPVLRGANCGESSEAVCIDWLRVSCKRESFVEVREIWRSYFGTGEPARGRYNLSQGERYGSSGGVYWDENEFYCILEASGELLRTIGHCQVFGLLQRLVECGCSVKRLDLAVDVFSDRVFLLDCVERSCASGELCGARRWRLTEERTGAVVSGRMVCLGRRGSDGSGRYVRVYDKGLEQGELRANTWVRWEAELSDDVATQAAIRICKADNAFAELRAIAVGSVEFRTVTGRQHLAERPLVPWYEELAKGDTRMLRAQRVKTSFDRWAGWVREAVVPTVSTFSKMLGMEIPEFLRWLGASFEARERCQKSDVGRHVLRIVNGGDVAEGDVEVIAAGFAESASIEVPEVLR